MFKEKCKKKKSILTHLPIVRSHVVKYNVATRCAVINKPAVERKKQSYRVHYKHNSSNQLQSFTGHTKSTNPETSSESKTIIRLQPHRYNAKHVRPCTHTHMKMCTNTETLLPEQLLVALFPVTVCSPPNVTIMYNSPLSFIKIIIRWGKQRSLAVK